MCRGSGCKDKAVGERPRAKVLLAQLATDDNVQNMKCLVKTVLLQTLVLENLTLSFVVGASLIQEMNDSVVLAK